MLPLVPVKVLFRARSLACKAISTATSGAAEQIKSHIHLRKPIAVAFLPNDLSSAKLRKVASIQAVGGGVDVKKSPRRKTFTTEELWEQWPLLDAFEALNRLAQGSSFIPYTVFYRVLKRCTAVKDLHLGMRVHALALANGYESNTFLANHFIRMYTSCGRFPEAMQVFSKVTSPDIFMWHSMMSAYVEHGQPNMAVESYKKMRKSATKPNNYVYVAVLKACAHAGDVIFGKQVHADVVASGAEIDVFIGSCLVAMYAKCGWLNEARKVYDSLPTRNVVTSTAMIAGYSDHGFCEEALSVYACMQREQITPDRYTFACLLKACGSARALQQGKELHKQIRARGVECDVVVGNCLVSMYAKCGSLKDARKVFDSLPSRDVVTWNTMLTEYVEQGYCEKALGLYSGMQDGGIAPSSFTYACLVKACIGVKDLQMGMDIYSQMLGRGVEVDLVLGNCLVELHAKCGSMEEAHKVFDNLHTKDVAVWTAMIAGYAQRGSCKDALALYASMRAEGMIRANHVTYACLLQACASEGALSQGKQLHAEILEREMETDVVVGNSLIDMYAKCGRMEDAREVFDRLPTRDVVTWTALLKGYAEHNDGHMALQCYEEMQEQGVKPDGTTFVCLLVACSHKGLLDEAQHYFKLMTEEYKILPTVYHHSCMVDLVGRCGRLEEAESMLQTLSLENDVVGWISLLSACKSYHDIERGRRCFERLIKLEPKNASAYALMSTMYANEGMRSAAQEVESLRKCAGALKKPAKACVEVKGEMHKFVVGEHREDVASKLRSVNLEKDGGYPPHTELLKSMSEGEPNDALCGHAEKLALAYGLLQTPDGTTLHVTKNLRMCNDCHDGTKMMSKLERREIVVRDAHRIHRFVDGSCSCGENV